MISKKRNWAPFALAAVLIICTVVGIIMVFRARAREDETTAKVREAMKATGTTVNKTYEALVEQNVTNFDALLNTHFKGWNLQSDVLANLTLFAINLIEYIIANGETEKPSFIIVVRKIVEVIKDELKKKPFNKTSIPWGRNWFPFSVHVSRLFVMFQYYGHDTSLGYECHQQLIRMIPEIGVSLRPKNQQHKELNLFYMTVPRLCSNYMYDPAAYEKDIETKAFKELKQYLLLEPMDPVAVNEGFYKDNSCIYSENVASYAVLRLFHDFHDRVYRAFGFSTGLKEAATKVFPLILHPSIPFVPLGLWGRTGDLINHRNFPLELKNTGIFIAPFIGFGVFKTPQMLFYVRIQRPDIAAYQIKSHEGSQDLALGWVQMRKIYTRNQDLQPIYKKELTWKTLKEQPGLLIFPNQDSYDADVFKEKDVGDVNLFRSFNIDSFIGQINKEESDMTKKLLFWKNSYKFSQAYKNKNVEITEVAVVTNKGLQAYYTINNQSGKQLRFNYNDKLLTEFHSSVDGNKPPDFYTVPEGPSSFGWKMLNDEVDYKVKFEDKIMSFTFLKTDYKATTITDNESFKLEGGVQPEIYNIKLSK